MEDDNKKIAIMQPYLFPYIGYWQLINAVDTFVLFDDVNFIKKGWINRNNILLNAQKHLFTLPLKKVSQFSHINEIQVTDETKTKSNILKTIQMAYSKAPFYNDIFPIIEKSILFDGTSVSSLINYSIIEVLKYLDIKKEIVFSSEIKKNEALSSQEKIINIVKILNGKTYINPIGGQDLYNKEDFSKENLNLFFIKTNEIIYKQFKNEFIPNLSFIDVLMFNPPQKIKEMLDNYELI